MEDNCWKNSLTSALRRAWLDKLYTDLTIVTADETFHTHKLILSVASPYFKALLSVEMNESSSECLKLEKISGENFRVILDYIYSGKCNLTGDNAAEILSLTDYFQIQDLKRLCCMFIKATLTPNICLPIYELALLHRCQDLAASAFNMALKNCSAVISLPSFLEIQPSTIRSLFQQPILDITSEDELFKILMKWVNFNEKERRTYYSELLSYIREGQMNPIMRAVYNEKVEEEESHSCLQEDFRTSFPHDSRIVARHKKEEELIVVFGGESNGRILGTAECIALGWTSWCCSIPNYSEPDVGINQIEGQQVIPPMHVARTYPAIAVNDNIVYLIGGQTPNQIVKSCETYDLKTNKWSSFPELPLCLHGEEAVFLQDRLWVVGGKNATKDNANKMFMFEPKVGGWKEKNSDFLGRVHCACAALHGALFLTGGIGTDGTGKQTALAVCQKYDVDTDTWTDIAPMNHRRAYHRVAVVNDVIYAVGGYDGFKWLNSVEKYDTLKDRWTFVSPMIGTRSSFAITVSNGRVYCIGGFSGESILNTVEKYNPRTDLWHCVQSMRLRRYGAVAATLKLPSEKLSADQYSSFRS